MGEPLNKTDNLIRTIWRFIKFSRIVSFAHCMVLLSAFQIQSKDFIWEVTKNGNTHYLGGTIHALRATDYPLPVSFDAAFTVSERIVFEADLGTFDDDSVLDYIWQEAISRSGATLSEKLIANDYEKLRNFAVNQGFEADAFNDFQPWFVFLLVYVDTIRNGLDPDIGVDQHFYDRSISEGKELAFLETARQQIDSVAAISETEVLRGISDFLNGGEISVIDETAGTIAAWRNGELSSEEFNRDVIKLAAPSAYVELLLKRNLRWLPKIENWFNESKPTLVLVGAGHFSSSDGLLALLTKRGFSLKQLVGDVDILPTIITHPQSEIVEERQSVQFSATVADAKNLSFQWQYNGQDIAGATSASYSIKNVQASNAGDYRIVVRNSFGTVFSETARLTVMENLPIITSHPQSQMVDEEKSVLFNVTVLETQNVTYQWQRNGLYIAGATASQFSIETLQLWNTGDYSVIVSTSAGKVVSEIATLTVVPKSIPTTPTGDSTDTTLKLAVLIQGIKNASASYHLSWPRSPSTQYQLERSTDLVNWNIDNGFPIETQDYFAQEVTNTDGTHAFFRVRQLETTPLFITSEMAAYYPFSGDYKDATSNRRDGQPIGARLGIDRFGKSNQALELDGKSSVMLLNTADLNLSNSFSITFWLKKIPGYYGYTALVSKHQAWSDNDTSWFLFTWRSDQLGFIYPWLSYDIFLPGFNSLDGWNHLAFVYDRTRGTWTFYQNGLSKASGSADLPRDNTSFPIVLGAEMAENGDGFSSFFTGMLDEVRFFMNALGPEDIKAIYETETVP
jgi:uncharacterized protein